MNEWMNESFIFSLAKYYYVEKYLNDNTMVRTDYHLTDSVIIYV